jgi:hypothetical protein
MSQQRKSKLTHTDIELMHLRLALTPGQRIQSMLDVRALLVGIIRGRLRKKHPDISEVELNLKLLAEIERSQNARPWPRSVSRRSD